MQIKIEANNANQRLDAFLATQLPDKSRAQIQKLLKQELILVNNSSVKKKYNLLENDTITILEEPETENPLQPIRKPLNIIFQDEDILVINKPPNLSVHQDIQGYQKETLINWLLGNEIQLSSIGGIHRPGIVHRLDKDTSGIMIIAKNDKAHHNLQKQFADRLVSKSYITLAEGLLPTLKGTIDAPISRDQANRKKMKVQATSNSKHAISHFEVLETYKLPDKLKSTKRASLLKIDIETGRTHQIRVHLNSINHPVIGDTKYGSDKTNQLFRKVGLDRQFLHAHKLSFTHPTTGERMNLEAELSPDLQATLKKLSQA